MKRQPGGPCLSAVFVDYDNIYLSLKRKSEEAAKRFAKDASVWIREIESGRRTLSYRAEVGDHLLLLSFILDREGNVWELSLEEEE